MAALASIIVYTAGTDTEDLAATVASILGQTFTHFELILAGSTAGVRAPWTADRRVSVHRNIRQSFAAACDNAVARSGGEFVCCVAAGDRLSRTYLEKSLFVLETSGQDICVGLQQGVPSLANSPAAEESVLRVPSAIRGVLFRKQAWEDLGGLDASLPRACGEWDLAIRTRLAISRIQVISELLCELGTAMRDGADLGPACSERLRSKHASAYANGLRFAATHSFRPFGQAFCYARMLKPNEATRQTTVVVALSDKAAATDALVLRGCAELARAGARVLVYIPGAAAGRGTERLHRFEGVADAVYDAGRFPDRDERQLFFEYLLRRHAATGLWQTSSSGAAAILPRIRARFPALSIVGLACDSAGCADYVRDAYLFDHVITDNEAARETLLDQGETEENILVVPGRTADTAYDYGIAALFQTLAGVRRSVMPATSATALRTGPQPASRLLAPFRTAILPLISAPLMASIRNAVLWACVVCRAQTRTAARALFNKAFYKAEYDDVRRAGVSPLVHYLFKGYRECRNPSALFDTGHYLHTYEDVSRSGVNPLLHYLIFGLREHREPLPLSSQAEVKATSFAGANSCFSRSEC